MPDIIDMLQALPHAVTPEPAGPDLAAADVARGHRALVQRRRRLTGVTGAAALGAAAAVLAVTSVPQPAAPARSAPRAPAAASPQTTSPLMTLAARISASDSSQPGNASLEIVKNIIGGKLKQVYYGLYTDSGKLYSGDSKQTLMAAIAQRANLATTYDSQVAAAAREAVTGDLAAARMQMIHATRSVSKEQFSNVLWTNATYALNWAGGDLKVRAGVLRLLSTISAVKVVNSTTDGQPTLTITAGSGAFGGMGDEVLVISAATGLPVSSVSNPGPSQGADYYQVSRVTLASIEAGKF
ncbi:MAG TPA: hypothetical protein VK817_16050 [Trebonia sp.]|jgi:hypothetical protein|nr:hypothetical protein [Trebonia sp.]